MLNECVMRLLRGSRCRALRVSCPFPKTMFLSTLDPARDGKWCWLRDNILSNASSEWKSLRNSIEIAQANVTRNQRRLKCQHVELVTTDVLQYEIPRDMTVAYFYSPFTGEIFKSVIGRIGRSLEERADRRLWIVLQRPTYGLDAAELKVYQEPEDLLRATPWLQHVSSIPVKSRHWATEISIYRATDR